MCRSFCSVECVRSVSWAKQKKRKVCFFKIFMVLYITCRWWSHTRGQSFISTIIGCRWLYKKIYFAKCDGFSTVCVLFLLHRSLSPMNKFKCNAIRSTEKKIIDVYLRPMRFRYFHFFSFWFLIALCLHNMCHVFWKIRNEVIQRTEWRSYRNHCINTDKLWVSTLIAFLVLTACVVISSAGCKYNHLFNTWICLYA
jgi:hypothetical protein